MAVSILVGLISVPLALKFLGEAEFGLWSLTVQIAGYIALLDMGLRVSVSRTLVDHKDDRGNGRYGSVILSGFMLAGIQGTIVLAIGMGLVWFLGGWLHIPPELARAFFWIMTVQFVIGAVALCTQMSNQILTAWQRGDVSNYLQTVQQLLWVAVMWCGFAAGLRVYGMLLAGVVAWAVFAAGSALACQRLYLWPKKHEWGRVSKQELRGLLGYGSDVFLIALGNQAILSSQTILATRLLNMKGVAIWVVMTKTFTLGSQLLFGTIGNSMPVFSEMYVRGENDLLWKRYRGMFMIMTVGATIFALLIAACNGSFVRAWTHGRVSWPQINDILLAAWLLLLTQTCCHNSLLLYLKQVRGLRYAYLVEGILFVTSATIAIPRYGFTGMLLCSVFCTLFCTYGYGLWRVSRMAKEAARPPLWTWHLPLARVLVVVVPCWLVGEWLTRDMADRTRLVCLAGLLSVVGLIAALGFALPRNLATEFAERLPQPAKRWLSALTKRLWASRA
jgi:O-antigen/teichoic acid export membrane protein